MKSIKKNAICFTIIVHWKLKLLNSWWIPSLYRLNFQQLFCLHSFLTAPPTLHWPQRRLNTLCSSELFRQKSCSMNLVYNLFNILDGRMRLVWFTTHPRTIPRWDRYSVFESLLNLVISVMNGFYILSLSLFFFLKISKELAKSLRNNGTKIVANEGFTQDPAVAVKILKVRFSIATLGSSRNRPTRDEALRTSVWVATFFILLLFLDKRSYWSLDIVSLF